MSVNHSFERGEMRTEKYSVSRLLFIAIVALASEPSWAQSAFTKWTRYDAASRVVGTIAADPDTSGPIHYAATRNTYDTRGLLTRVEIGELATWQSETVVPASWAGFTVFRQVDYTYDSYGQKLSQMTSSGGVGSKLTQFSYDNFGRLDCTAVRMNTGAFAADLGVSACQLGVEGTLGPDRIEKTTYDSYDRPLTVTRAYLTSLQQVYATYTYTSAHRASARDANGNVSTFNVDGFGRLEYWYFPSKTSPGQTSTTDFEKYGYDENDNRTLLRKRDGNQMIFGYDTLNRITSRDLPGSSLDVSLGYDLRGRQLYSRFTASGLGITNTYDGFGMLASSTTNVGGSTRVLSYGYDADGNRTRITYPDGAFFQYSFDGLDRLWRICENDTNCDTSATPTISVAYNAQGRRWTLTRGATVSSTTYGYDAISRLNSVAQDLDGPGAGSDVTQSFILNPAGQIVSRTISNIAYANTPALSSLTYSVNGLNQYTQVTSPGVAAFSYDANGNLTSDGSTTFGYDVENRLISASGTFNTSLAYDPNGRLYQSSGANTTQFLYDGNHMIAEYSGSGTLLRRYLHASIFGDEPLLWYEGSGVGSANRRYFHANHAGSVIAVANNSGSTIEKDTYDPYGVPGSLNTSRFQFTGQAYMPELGLYFYKARFYNPSIGRFMQTDPIGFQDEMNIYAYAHNDPMNNADPSGTFCLFGIEILGDWGGSCTKHDPPPKQEQEKKNEPEKQEKEEKPVEDEVRDKVIEDAGVKVVGKTLEEIEGRKAAAALEIGVGALAGAEAIGSVLNSKMAADYRDWKASGGESHSDSDFEGYNWRGDTAEEAIHNFMIDKGVIKPDK